MIIEEGNVFSFAGIVETPTSFNGAIALYDYLWALKPELREKLIRSWISLLENVLKEDVLDEIDFEYVDGTATVFVDEEPIEIRDIPDNVIQFRGLDGQRVKTKKNGN